jgi:hypothetical protein
MLNAINFGNFERWKKRERDLNISYVTVLAIIIFISNEYL